MSTLQLDIQTEAQWTQLVAFLQQLKVEFKLVENEEKWADAEADANPNDCYESAMPVLARDWDKPEDDHWDNY